MSDYSSFGRISILPDQNLDPRRLLTVMAPSAPPERQSLKPEDPWLNAIQPRTSGRKGLVIYTQAPMIR